MVALLVTPATVTYTGPVTASTEAVTVMSVSDQLTTLGVRPPRLTVLVPCVVPKPLPMIWTCDPVGPLTGLVLATFGFAANAAVLNSTRTNNQLRKRECMSPGLQVSQSKVKSCQRLYGFGSKT